MMMLTPGGAKDVDPSPWYYHRRGSPFSSLPHNNEVICTIYERCDEIIDLASNVLFDEEE